MEVPQICQRKENFAEIKGIEEKIRTEAQTDEHTRSITPSFPCNNKNTKINSMFLIFSLLPPRRKNQLGKEIRQLNHCKGRKQTTSSSTYIDERGGGGYFILSLNPLCQECVEIEVSLIWIRGNDG